MDKLTRQLREDAAEIKVSVSPELDSRIRASLTGIEPVRPREKMRSPIFWLASSLTGLAAAVAVIVFINVSEQAPGPVPVAASPPEIFLPELPTLPLRAERAMSTSPLEKELDDFQADLKKAQRAVEEDVRQIF